MSIRLETARGGHLRGAGRKLSTWTVGIAGGWRYWRGEGLADLRRHEVFVFESNLAGRHGLGASREAVLRYGARYGVGEGLVGRSYAVPTKDEQLMPLSLPQLAVHVGRFIEVASHRADLHFVVAEFGSDWDVWEVAPLFERSPRNVVLPARFVDVLMG